MNGLFLDQIRSVGWSDVRRVARWFLLVNGVIAVAFFVYQLQPYRLLFNNTLSMDRGLWLMLAEPERHYEMGQVVSAHYVAPEWIAARPWYDPLHHQILKRVMAVPGDHLRVDGLKIFNCGQAGDECQMIARRMTQDSNGLPLYYQKLPSVVPAGRYFLRGDHPRSLDSRYLGLFSIHAIEGEAFSFWVRELPPTAEQKLAKSAIWAAIPETRLDKPPTGLYAVTTLLSGES